MEMPLSKIRLVTGMLLSNVAFAFAAIQFDAATTRSVAQTNGAVAAWMSVRGGVEASPCHVEGAGWGLPRFDGGGISYSAGGGDAATPLSFDTSQTGLVSRAFIVADAASAAPWQTLLDAPCPLRILPDAGAGAVAFSTSSVLSSISLSIDFAPDATFTPGRHTYEAVFAEPCPLGGIHVGGNPATPAWGRSWCGSIHEVVFLPPEATEADARAVRAYLAKKWGTGCYSSGLADELAVLRALGMKTGTLYGTGMFAR